MRPNFLTAVITKGYIELHANMVSKGTLSFWNAVKNRFHKNQRPLRTEVNEENRNGNGVVWVSIKEHEEGPQVNTSDTNTVNAVTVTHANGETKNDANSEEKPQAPLIYNNETHIFGNYELVCMLGSGGFGKVFLARKLHMKSRKLQHRQAMCAVKVIPFSKSRGTLIYTPNHNSKEPKEEEILTAVNHPFLINILDCFQTATAKVLVLEFLPGGDFCNIMTYSKKLPECFVKFYAAEIVLALQYLHDLGIVYRDLKLDNLMIGRDGHIKLVDFGIAMTNMRFDKLLDGKGVAVTPVHVPPEVIIGTIYGFGEDWWGLGTIIYTMLMGNEPFLRSSYEETYNAIMNDDPVFDPTIQENEILVSLIKNLLAKDPRDRLGCTKLDAAEVMCHDYFKKTNWDKLLATKVLPPILPILSSPEDVRYFRDEVTSLPICITDYGDVKVIVDKTNTPFKKPDKQRRYKALSVHQKEIKEITSKKVKTKTVGGHASMPKYYSFLPDF